MTGSLLQPAHRSGPSGPDEARASSAFGLTTTQITLQPRIVRSRSGCLTCRSRRKKCDEKKPTCIGCTRNKLDCVWPSPADQDALKRPPVRKASTDRKGQRPAHLAQSETGLNVAHAEGIRDDINHSMAQVERQLIQQKRVLGRSSPPGDLSSYPSFMKGDRAGQVFQHWIKNTAPRLSAASSSENPLVVHALPLAQKDSILYHVILALSAIHMNTNAPDPDLKLFALTHHFIALRKLRNALSGKDVRPSESQMSLPLTVLLLRLFEALYGNSRAAVTSHLEASRRLIRATHPTSLRSPEEKGLYQFLIQYHALMTLADHVCFARDNILGTEVSEPLLRTLSVMQNYRATGRVDEVNNVFELITIAHELGHRLAFTKSLPDESNPNLATWRMLESHVCSWNDAESPAAATRRLNRRNKDQRIAGRIYQIAMVIFLYAAYYRTYKDNDAFREKVDPYVQEALRLAPEIVHTYISITLLWPLIVVGSCLVSEADRTKLKKLIATSEHTRLPITQKILEILQLTWDDPDEDMFGPSATEIIMMKNGIDFVSA